MEKARRIAYIMSRFPGLSETFILREMCEIERLGWGIELYPLIYQEESVVHDEARVWMERAHRPTIFDIVGSNVHLLLMRPRLFFSVLFTILRENIHSPKFLSRALMVYPEAIWMARQMLSQEICLVHAHYATHPALAAWIINQVAGIPYGITVHAHDIFVDRSMLPRKINAAKYIVAISEFNREFLANLYGPLVAKRTHIIHCGIVTDIYGSKPVDADRSNGFELLSIGSLRSYKGFAFLLEACDLLKRIGLRFRCRIIGDGELRASLIAKVEKLDLSEIVQFVGPKNQEEVAGFLSTADCYVQPSIITATGKMEGIPVSLMEAMASELPVIATAISGIPELVRPPETGWLVPPADPQALANAILDVRNNPEEARRRARSGRNLVFQEFDISVTAGLLSDLFNTAVEDILWN